MAACRYWKAKKLAYDGADRPDLHGTLWRELNAAEGWLLAAISETDELDAALDAIPSGWQPIQTAPKDGTYMLLESPAHGRVIGAHVTGDVWHLVGVGAVSGESERPTHWMPLPPPQPR